jgi:P27 family predicted phage terminase small subunit
MGNRGKQSAAALAVIPVAIEDGPTAKAPEPPAHLSDEAAQWWRSVTTDYELEGHHLRLLQSACESWDRMQQARRALADHGGLTFTDERGTIRAHPCVAMERDSQIRFARLVRELDLDTGAPAETRRPPALLSNRRNGHAG